jgi:hypothetical protein
MADMIKFFKGLEASLPTSGVNGALYITTDEGAIYLGTGTGMKRLGDFVQVDNVASLPTKAHESCLYYCVAENILAKWNGAEWKQINKQPTAEELKGLLGLGSLAYKSEVAEADLNADLKAKVNAAAEGNHSHDNKVLLDTYTQTEADLADAVAKKHEHANAVELAKIADGDVAKWNTAQANVIESVKVNGEALQITDKAVDIAIPTGALAGKDKVAKTDLATELAAEIDNKVAKETNKSLIADSEIARLAGMSDGANKVEASATNGKIKIDGVETTVYTHPEKHAIADVTGLQDALAGLQEKGDYAAEEHTHTKSEITDFAHTHTKSEITDFAHTHTASEITDFATEAAKVKVTNAGNADSANKVANALTVKVGGADVVFDGSAAKTADVDAAIEAAINAIPEQTDYTVTITENTDDVTVAKTYVFSQNGAEIGTIKLAKELVVTAGSVKEVETADAPYAGAKVGEKYIELVIANQDAPIYVPAKDLVDIYTAKDGATEVQVAISNTNEISATLVNGGVTEDKLAEAVKTKLNKVYEEVGVAQGLVDGLANSQVKTNKEAIEKLNGADTVEGSVAKSIKDAIAGENLGQYAKTGDLGALAALNTITADKVTDFATEVAKVKVNNAAKADEATKATQDGNGKVIADTYAEKATTLAGYGIADAYTKTEVEALLTWGSF